MNQLRRWIGMLGMVAMMFVMVAQAVTICTQCGYEVVDGAKTCGHCNAPVAAPPPPPATKPDSPPEHPVGAGADALSVDPELADILIVAAREDVQAGREEEGKDRPGIAALYYGNALALVTVAGQSEMGEHLLTSIKRCRREGQDEQRNCFDCRGTGRISVEMDNLSGAVTIKGATLKCPTCNGAGVVRGLRSVEHLKVQLARARQEFDQRQMVAGRVSNGAVWIPPAATGKLNARQTATLRRVAARPCSQCMGLGLQDCKRCPNHTGRVKCTHEGCKDGWILPSSSNNRTPSFNTGSAGTQGPLSKQSTRCPACKGTGYVACTECNGDGRVVCSSCKGAGQRAICTRCAGQGVATCRRCQGSGKYQDVECRDCRGEGVVLCTTCNGDGHAAR